MARKSEDKRMTEILHAVQRGGEKAVFNRYFEVARQLAEKHMHGGLRGRVGPTDIAQEAIRSAISAIQSKPDPLSSSDEFEALLLATVRRKVVSAARREGAAKRSGGRKREPSEDAVAEDGLTLPENIAQREVAEAIYAFLLKEEDPYRRDIDVLGILAGASASSIRKTLAAVYTDISAPSPRTIHLRLGKTRERLKEHLKRALEKTNTSTDDADE